MTSKPALVFVPGAWHDVSCYCKVVALLTSSYKCVTVSLPCTSGSNEGTFFDDITAVRTVILAETTAGHDVAIVAHSYGGQVANRSFRGLAKSKTSENENGHGYVIGIIFLASGFNVTGISFLEGAGGKPPPSWIAEETTGFATIVAYPREMFYLDLPVEEGEYWVSQLRKQSLKALSEGGDHAYSGWNEVPA